MTKMLSKIRGPKLNRSDALSFGGAQRCLIEIEQSLSNAAEKIPPSFLKTCCKEGNSLFPCFVSRPCFLIFALQRFLRISEPSHAFSAPLMKAIPQKAAKVDWVASIQ